LTAAIDNNKEYPSNLYVYISILKLKVTLNIKIYENQFIEYISGQLAIFDCLFFKEWCSCSLS